MMIKHEKLALVELRYETTDNKHKLSEKDIKDMFNYSVILEGIKIKCVSVSDIPKGK